jgi:hypothetical protein
MTAALSRYDPIKGCFVLKDLKPKLPANAFEWKRYVVEEAARRGEKPAPIASKTATIIDMKPKLFIVYSRAKG